MDNRKWFDSTQPQTLQSAVLLSYLNAALALFYALVSPGSNTLLLPLLLGGGLGAVGIANERRWGYWVCLACVLAYLAFWLLIVFAYGLTLGIVLNLLFAVVLVALLVHPQSREYRRIWFH